MEIIMLSKEKVKPSTPTPPHLRKHKLNFIDQLLFDVSIKPVFFYKKIYSEKFLNHLKNTLSQTLTIFYPLAGELKKYSTFVDCNDNGVLFVEAQVKVRLDEFLQQPNFSQLFNFIPQNGSLNIMKISVESLDTLVSIQATRFDCGGVGIGVVLPHALLDGISMSLFFNTWAIIARGDNRIENIYIDFTSASLLYQVDQIHFSKELLAIQQKLFASEGDSILKRRFVFNANAIESIKKQASSERVPCPTRIQALTAFIWKHMILATRAVRGNSRACRASHAVNLRPRLETKLPNAFGNLAFNATTEIIEMCDQIIEISHLVGLVRESIEHTNSIKLNDLEGDGILTHFATIDGPLLTKVDEYKFTSWCRFGLYDVDFGWGKPIWFAPYISVSDNIQAILLVETGSSDGVEAWICRNKEEILELEKDEEFLAYASPNPSIHVDYL